MINSCEIILFPVRSIHGAFSFADGTRCCRKTAKWGEFRVIVVLYGSANDPGTANDPGPQMIPKLDRK